LPSVGPVRMGRMGIFDKAKDALSEHSEHVDTGIEKGGDFVDEKTGNKYVEQVDKGQDLATDHVREYAGEDQPEQPA
jgi:MT0933-like antitoxin protein